MPHHARGLIMNSFYGWVDPGFLQGMLVAFLMTAVSVVALIAVLTLIANRNVVAGILLIIPAGLVYLYLIVAQAYAAYLMINNGVTGWDWLLLVLYVLSIFNGGVSLSFSGND